MKPARRRFLSRSLAALAVLATLFAAILFYAERTLFDSDTFANRAVSVLDDEAVQEQLASTITDAAIEQVPNAVAARPLIQSVAGLLVRSPALQTLLARGVRDVHASLFDEDAQSVTLTLANIGVLVKSGLQVAAPKLADEISRKLDVDLLEQGDDSGEGITIDVAQGGSDLSALGWIGVVVALGAAGGSIALAPTRLAGIRRVGRSLAIGGIAAIVVWQLGRAILVGQIGGDGGEVAKAVYNAFLGDLRTWLLVLSGAGVVITAGASSTREPIDVGALGARAWARVTAVPDSTLPRLARAVLLIAAGLLVIENRDAVLTIAVVAAGAFVIYVGAAELMRMAAGTVRADEARPSAARDAERDLGTGALVRIAAVGVVLLGAFVLVGLGTNDEEGPPLSVDTCNGSVELCDKRLDEVAFAGTHNSMSAATYDGWFFAQQEEGIAQQLGAGIRALLIDPHYGFPTKSGRIGTDLESDLGSRQKIEAGLGPEAIAATEQIRGQAGFERSGDTEVYLCHGFCEPGAITWVSGLREVRDFLVANPGEVVVMSIEDATTPADTVAGIEAAGLGRFVYEGPDEPLPTLREMIDSNKRLFVMAERDGGDPPWYRRQFEITQETPFSFSKPEQLRKRASCKPNRGPDDAPFFLMNHWIDTSPAPRPTNAKVVNQKKFLLDRVELCTEVRGIQPSILAVDFYKQGDVVGAVDELNGVG